MSRARAARSLLLVSFGNVVAERGCSAFAPGWRNVATLSSFAARGPVSSPARTPRCLPERQLYAAGRSRGSRMAAPCRPTGGDSDDSPAAGKSEDFLASPDAQLQGYEAAATVWVFAAGLHLLTFSLLNPAVWTTRALFAMGSSHFLLWLLSIRALRVAVSKNLLENPTYQQACNSQKSHIVALHRKYTRALTFENLSKLNLGLMVSACLAGLVTISKFILQGVAEVAVPLTSLVASTIMVLVSARVWQLSIISSHEQRSSNASLSDFEKAVMALVDGAFVTLKQLIAPKSIDGIVYRGMFAFFFTAFLVAIFQPTSFLSLLHLVPPWEGRIDAAVAAWAPGLLYQVFTTILEIICYNNNTRYFREMFNM